jgi:hypothetical protein
MGVRVRFDRGAWWVFVHHRWQRTKQCIGPDRQAAEETARELRRKLPLLDLGVSQVYAPASLVGGVGMGGWLAVGRAPRRKGRLDLV